MPARENFKLNELELQVQIATVSGSASEASRPGRQRTRIGSHVRVAGDRDDSDAGVPLAMPGLAVPVPA